MKTITMRELQRSIKACVDDSQRDRVVVTRHGRPAAVMVGVEGEDWESVVTRTDLSFWKLIQLRRRQPTLSLEQLRARLGLPASSAIPRRGARRPGGRPPR